jgi:hypothetical protein
MTRVKDIVQWQTISGRPMTVGDVSVAPQSQALTVRLPWGGFVWNRPVAVLVERGESHHIERIPVVDVTRLIQLGLLGFSLLFWMAAMAKFARRKEESL